MTLTLSITTDKTTYSPGEAVTVTANFSDPATAFTVNVTATAQDPAGNTATAGTSYTVTPNPGPVTLTVVDDQGGGYTQQSSTAGIARLTGTAPAAGKHILSGFTGAEPALTQAGGAALPWAGYTWEREDWGTAPGQPKAANVNLRTDNALLLNTSVISGNYAGAEIDSARGDQGITANPSTWGYGTYRWTIGTDLTTLPPGLVLGLFTYWATSKGGPAGQKEIDIEFYSAGTIPGAPAFVQLGYYQDTTAQITQGVPQGHTLIPGSQFAIPSKPSYAAEFTWLPNLITWKLSSGGELLTQLTMTHGQPYSYTQLYGGNQFSGIVDIPVTGKQQVIANLWCPNGAPPPGNAPASVALTGFTYTQP